MENLPKFPRLLPYIPIANPVAPSGDPVESYRTIYGMNGEFRMEEWRALEADDPRDTAARQTAIEDALQEWFRDFVGRWKVEIFQETIDSKRRNDTKLIMMAEFEVNQEGHLSSGEIEWID